MSTGNEEEGKIYIDDDWKAEAAAEKERLAKEETQTQAAGPAGAAAAPGFLDLLNILAMQAAIALGGYKGPGGESMPPNMQTAKHHIDLISVLEDKTAGNLTDEEKRTLDRILYELRMQYVQMVNGPTPGAGSTGAAPM